MSRGKLKPEDERCIQSNYLYLKENLDALHIVDYLFQHRVLSFDDKEKICTSGLSRNERNEILLKILLMSGPGESFNFFLKSLEKDYQYILDEMGRTDEHLRSWNNEKDQLMSQILMTNKTLETENLALKRVKEELDTELKMCREENEKLKKEVMKLNEILEIQMKENKNVWKEFAEYKLSIESSKDQENKDNDVEQEIIHNDNSSDTVQFHYEVELLANGDDDVDTCMSRCQKYEDHSDFIPADTFTINSLPTGYRERPLYELVKTLADLTVRVDVAHTSMDRPEFLPGTTQPFPFSDIRGSNVLRTGSGFIHEVSLIEDKHEYIDQAFELRTCSCDKCQNSKTPSSKFWEISVITTNMVVYNKSEACQTSCRLFYDTLKDFSLLNSPTKFKKEADDLVIVFHETCEEDVATRLQEKLQDYEKLCTEVYCQNFSNSSKYIFIVSHPHGSTKKISYSLLHETNKASDTSSSFTLVYTTKTCFGSSGAPVYVLGYEKNDYLFHPVHCGTVQDGLNFSGIVNKRIAYLNNQESNSDSSCLLM